ncbi:N-formylglutamate amidohydrolase [Roseibium algae]|uniref:N-formylglutamate amidohydrolase n=1 Tax=Roseibium algae TaxID=3123038 RepID=A0ABU8THN1_9HYPH
MTIGIPGNDPFDPVTILNKDGTSPFVLVCEHASNFRPAAYGDLGLKASDLEAHIAWDPGALGVSTELSKLLDAPLVHSNVSRLIIDCNRAEDAHDLVPSCSELTNIPKNMGIDSEERSRRIALSHAPFHAAVEAIIEDRLAMGKETAIVSLHSYTPIYKGFSRPWEIGLIYGQDASLAKPALKALNATPYNVGDNEPYSPSDGVYYTLHRHGEARGLKSLMIEIRNDEIADTASESAWAKRLAPILTEALELSGGDNA